LETAAFQRGIRVLFGAGLVLLAVVETCAADPKDYRIELVDKTLKARLGAIIGIRVVNISSKKSVTDAVVRVIALDMSPDGMAEMNAKTGPMPSNDAEIHNFSADLSMPGRWALSLEAIIPGESTPIQDKLLLKTRR